MRLYDEKRREINVGDTIIFESRENGELLNTEVVDLHIFDSFEELYSNFDKVSLGYSIDEEANPSDMEIYYSKEEQEKYGVVGIELRKKI